MIASSFFAMTGTVNYVYVSILCSEKDTLNVCIDVRFLLYNIYVVVCAEVKEIWRL